MMILSQTPFELQALLSLITEYANNECYTIHPEKTTIVPFNLKSNSQKAIKEIKPWTTNSKNIPVEDEMTHLGIRRNNTDQNAVIEDRLKLARKTLYALAGAGLHGFNGLPVKTCLKIYNAYVIPRALYGLETVKASETAKKKLNTFHKYSLRCMLGLPDWTAIPALYLLTGQLPILIQLDVKILNFIRSLMATQPARDIILRQYCTKSKNSHSMVNLFTEKLYHYNLPSILDIYKFKPEKKQWKKLVDEAVTKKFRKEIKEQAREYSTLKYLSHDFEKQPHPVVQSVENTRQVTRSVVKSMLITDTYPLLKNRKKMKKSENDTCPLCLTKPEDIEHFLLTCPTLDDVRKKYTRMLNSMLLNIPTIIGLLDSREAKKINPEINTDSLEKISKDYIFALHIRRTEVMRSNEKT